MEAEFRVPQILMDWFLKIGPNVSQSCSPTCYIATDLVLLMPHLCSSDAGLTGVHNVGTYEMPETERTRSFVLCKHSTSRAPLLVSSNPLKQQKHLKVLLPLAQAHKWKLARSP